MNSQQIIARIIFLLCGLFFSHEQSLRAQSEKVDSIFLLLQQSNQVQGVDTTKFNKALNLLEAADFTEEQLLQLESELLKFKGKQQGYGAYLKYVILGANKHKNYQRSIEYGKKLVEEWTQSNDPDLKLLSKSVLTLMRLQYRNSGNVVEGVKYYLQKLQEFKQLKDNRGIEVCYYVLGGFYRYMGLINQAIFSFKRTLNYIDSNNTQPYYFKNFQVSTGGGRARWYNNNYVISNYYFFNGDYDLAVKHARYNFLNNDNRRDRSPAKILGLDKIFKGELDSAFFYLNLTEINSLTTNGKADMYQVMSLYYMKKGDLMRAGSYIDSLNVLVEKAKIPADANSGIIHPDYYLGLIRIEQKKFTDAIQLLEKDNIRLVKNRSVLLVNYLLLADLYIKIKNYNKSSENYQKYIQLQKDIQKDQRAFEEAGFEMEMKLAKNEDKINQLEIQNKVNAATRNYVVAFAMLLLLLIGMVYFRFRAKQKANQVLEKTIQELKTTQQQLIQSEKMASLGELTAGIAHEIQNPLNFVNNFSEVSNELVDEMNEELAKGDIEEARSIAKDVKQNLEKITHHGKRADAIVKGMLQHSRSGSGQKEPTDINQLCDEYLRLAYHGLRAKDKSFNATLQTEFDESIGLVNVLPQDIGRVVLNLITNAFYAVADKAKQSYADYNPKVTVSTKKSGNQFEIKVTDNGNGIPQQLLDKIFQPFFTTKPTGEGTGLGLSLSYDIVKAHGGELKVESKEGEGTSFIIYIPIQ